MSYVDEVCQRAVLENPNEPEFHQIVREIFNPLRPVIELHEKMYRDACLLERLIEPERSISFRVPWVDDKGCLQINKGYRIQYNSAIGPYKGGLRFQTNVNMDLLKSLGFEQTFKNALTGLPIGGAKGGSNFSRAGKSDREVMAFCQSFMTELYRYIGDDYDIPAGDIGAGTRELAFLYGQYKRLTGLHNGAMTGKGASFSGSKLRPESTGHGLVFILEEMLRCHGMELEGKTVVVSGSGNVAGNAAAKLQHMGVKVVALSDSGGFIYDKDGIRLDVIKQIKMDHHGRIKEYIDEVPSAVYEEQKRIWSIPCDIALPCATAKELNLEDARMLKKNGCMAVAEGAILPCSQEAIGFFQENDMLFMPGNAANGGGVVVSALEMSQNGMHLSWTYEEVEQALRRVMAGIYHRTANAAERYGKKGDYSAGASIAAFEKIAEAMLAQGFV